MSGNAEKSRSGGVNGIMFPSLGALGIGGEFLYGSKKLIELPLP
jgi:hypothetical protein